MSTAGEIFIGCVIISFLFPPASVVLGPIGTLAFLKWMLWDSLPG